MLKQCLDVGKASRQQVDELLVLEFPFVELVVHQITMLVGGGDQQEAVVSQDAPQLVERRFRLGDMLDRLEGHHELERTVLEGKPADVRLHELRRGIARARMSDGPLIDVDSQRRGRSRFREETGPVTLSAGRIENSPRLGELNGN